MPFSRPDQLDEPSPTIFVQGYDGVGVEQLSLSNLFFHEFYDPGIYRPVPVEVELDQLMEVFEVISPRSRDSGPAIGR